MTERIFISYRRDDSAGHAGRVFDRLRQDFKDSVLFMDVDAIPLGSNFVRVLREEVARCSVLLAIIGPRWLEAADEDGKRRLDDPNDFVRVEIAAALARDIPVIPILLEGARIPKAGTLPEDIQDLSQRNGLDVRHASFHGDMDKLVRGLKGRADQTPGAAVSIPSTSPSVSPAPSIAGSDTLLGRFIRKQRDLVPTVDEAIAARGKWINDFGVDFHSTSPPAIFSHYFIQVRDINGKATDHTTLGSVLSGRAWKSADSRHMKEHVAWTVKHGHAWSAGWNYINSKWLTYLGPKWRPEYADLSDAVFKKLGGVPLARFITHP